MLLVNYQVMNGMISKLVKILQLMLINHQSISDTITLKIMLHTHS